MMNVTHVVTSVIGIENIDSERLIRVIFGNEIQHNHHGPNQNGINQLRKERRRRLQDLLGWVRSRKWNRFNGDTIQERESAPNKVTSGLYWHAG